MTIQKGQILVFFAFDVGYEINLEALREITGAVPVQPISRNKQTPPYLQYTKSPLVVPAGPAPELRTYAGRSQLTAFDFGAISLAYRWDITEGLSVADLPQLSRELYELGLEVHARTALSAWLQRLGPAIVRPELSDLAEDYYLFVLEEFGHSEPLDQWLETNASVLAKTLRFETSELSIDQQREALSQRVSYYTNDMVLVDWNAAIVCDSDYKDTVSVLELLNVELLEARYIDGRLDARIAEYASLIRDRAPWPLPFRTPYKHAIRELAELRIESSLLTERVDNSLKLIGDLFLARLHAAATQRFYLHEWERTISQKLNIVSEFYELLTDRVHTSQSQALELIVIVLILVELILAFLR